MTDYNVGSRKKMKAENKLLEKCGDNNSKSSCQNNSQMRSGSGK
jgi:hypothetical protein